MKRRISLLLVLLLCAGLFSGCEMWAGRGESSSEGEPAASSGSSASEAPPTTLPDAPPSERIDPETYRDAVSRLMWDGMLGKTWGESGYIPAEEPAGKGGGDSFYNFSLQSSEKLDDGSVRLEVELYGGASVDPKTQMDTQDYSQSLIYVEAHYASGSGDIPVAKSVLRLSGAGDDIRYLSCEYTRYEHPGYDYLVKIKELYQTQLDASEKIDVSKYDPALVAYFYRKIQGCRRIESPGEMTVFDLETFISYVNLYSYELENLGVPYREPLDSSIFELMPNLRSLDIGNVRLTDYGVFRDMKQADYISISGITQDVADRLEVGHTSGLNLNGADLDMLDLSRIHTESLNIAPGEKSLVRIDAFRGCDSLTNLYVNNLVSADGKLPTRGQDFPSLQYLTLDYNDNAAGVPDLSGLTSFSGASTGISVYLHGKSATPEAIRSLAGVRLENMTLSTGSPLSEFDWSMLDGIDCNSVNVSGGWR